MSRKLLFLGVLALALMPGGAYSLGLGDIRLESYLNQPLDAEIALSLASADELDSLKVNLASRDTFDRYGLPRPAFLDDLEFRIERTAGGAVVKVTSTQPILEPFVTFLLEARWAGGRVLREYTVLLDPPVYMPGEAAAPAVEAPAPARSAPLRQPEPVSEPRATTRPAPVATPRAAGADYGPVQRNETLWAIAERVRPDASVSMEQAMIALYRANPGAFDGNVNRLRAGAILRVPSRQEMTSITRGDAATEFRTQTRAWRAGQSSAPQQARLELVPPEESAPPAAPAAGPSAPATGGSGAGAGDAAQAEVMSAVQSLRDELDETRRMMEVKDAEIAALQARLAELESGGAVTPPPGEAAAEGPAGGAEAEAPGEETAAPEQEKPAVSTAVVEEPAEETRPAAEPPAPTVVMEPSFLDRVLAFLGSLWFWVILGLVVVAGAALHFARNRGGSSSIEEDLAETGTWGTLDTPKAAPAAAGAGLSETQKLRALEAEPDSILVDERQTPGARPVPPAAEAEVSDDAATDTAASDEDYQYPFEDTIAGESGVNLDQSDPLAEADFHMAYGLYDQAAEIMKKAIEREPERYDLRRKLVDICFVWGNADEFLAQARALKEMGGEEQAADWSKIAIMGSQICPDEALFASAGEEVGDVDVSLDAGEESGEEESEEWLDFDVGTAEGEEKTLGDTQEQPTLDEDEATVEQTAELDIEDLDIDLDLGETGEHALRDLAERAPEFTDETGEYIPGPDVEPEQAPESEPGTEEGTRVMAPEERPTPESGDETVESEVPGLEDEVTWTGGGSEEPTLTRVMEGPGEAGTDESDETAEVPLDESLKLDDLTEGVDVDIEEVGDDEATQLAPSLADYAEEGEDDTDDDTQEMPPVTMSEVGTKLDLARAYIDMGDPDGARSILEEVLAEGDDAQKSEARELIESLG